MDIALYHIKHWKNILYDQVKVDFKISPIVLEYVIDKMFAYTDENHYLKTM